MITVRVQSEEDMSVEEETLPPAEIALAQRKHAKERTKERPRRRAPSGFRGVYFAGSEPL